MNFLNSRSLFQKSDGEMEGRTTKVETVRHQGKLVRGSTYAAGLDFGLTTALTLSPGERAEGKSTVAIELPINSFGLVLPRSRYGKIGLQTFAGLIDADYTEPIWVTAVNLGTDIITLEAGEKAFQLVLCQQPVVNLREVDCSAHQLPTRGSSRPSRHRRSASSIIHGMEMEKTVSLFKALLNELDGKAPLRPAAKAIGLKLHRSGQVSSPGRMGGRDASPPRIMHPMHVPSTSLDEILRMVGVPSFSLYLLGEAQTQSQFEGKFGFGYLSVSGSPKSDPPLEGAHRTGPNQMPPAELGNALRELMDKGVPGTQNLPNSEWRERCIKVARSTLAAWRKQDTPLKERERFICQEGIIHETGLALASRFANIYGVQCLVYQPFPPNEAQDLSVKDEVIDNSAMERIVVEATGESAPLDVSSLPTSKKGSPPCVPPKSKDDESSSIPPDSDESGD